MSALKGQLEFLKRSVEHEQAACVKQLRQFAEPLLYRANMLSQASCEKREQLSDASGKLATALSQLHSANLAKDSLSKDLLDMTVAKEASHAEAQRVAKQATADSEACAKRI